MITVLTKLTTIEFNHYLQTDNPFIFRGGIKHWPALNLWSPAYFRQLFPQKMVTLHAINQIPLANHQFHIAEKKLLMPAAIELICKNSNPHKKHFFLPQSLTSYPELQADIRLLHGMEGSFHNKSFWFSEQGYITQLHFDNPHGLLAHIYGEKKINLYAPSQTPFLYSRPPSDKGYQFSYIHDVEKVDANLFPLFNKTVALTGQLHPGDLLFIPSGWWHEVHTLTTAISVSHWWREN